MPLVMNSTAIAAKKRPIILLKTIPPVTPKILFRVSEALRSIHVTKKVSPTAKSTNILKDVDWAIPISKITDVIAAGPVKRGMVNGTMYMYSRASSNSSSVYASLDLFAYIISIAIKNRRTPPATLSESVVILKNERIKSPVSAKNINRVQLQ